MIDPRELVVPVGWVLSVFGILGGIISTLAALLWTTMKDRLAAQDGIINRLQADVDRMAKGCGITTCIWRTK